jgi:hypothetical protein
VRHWHGTDLFAKELVIAKAKFWSEPTVLKFQAGGARGRHNRFRPVADTTSAVGRQAPERQPTPTAWPEADTIALVVPPAGLKCVNSAPVAHATGNGYFGLRPCLD